jgi:hypothetical protein
LSQVTCGSGSPFTWTFNSSLEPSLRDCSGLSPVRNEGGHIKESSGSRASSLVCPRDRTEFVESDLLYALCFLPLPPEVRASATSAADTPFVLGGSCILTVGALTTLLVLVSVNRRLVLL